MLDAAGQAQGFDVARMNSYEVHGLRVSSSAVRQAWARATWKRGAPAGPALHHLGHVVHGRKLGRALGASAATAGDGFRTLNLRFAHWKPAASGIFAVLVHGLASPAARRGQPGRAPLARPERRERRPRAAGNPLPDWPASLGAEGAYGKIIRVELLHKLHDELKYDSLDALTAGIAKDCADARAYFGLATPARTPRPGARPRATEFEGLPLRSARACGPASLVPVTPVFAPGRPGLPALRPFHVR
jgi:riboflavin kinase/FMN adenylyltransferase